MTASSVTGLSGKGSVISTPEKLRNLTNDLIAVNSSVSSTSNKINLVGKFNTNYYENYSAIMNHRLGDNGAVEFSGGGLFVVPGTSNRTCCDSCNGYYCDNWCCPCECCCGPDHPWFLMAVNADQMTRIEWSGRWKWYDVDVTQFTNVEEIWATNFTNGVLTIDGLQNLEDLGLKFATITNDLTISNCPDLGFLRIQRLEAENIIIDWDTCQDLYEIDFNSNDWDSDRVDDLLISFANSLVKYPRSGWYFAIQGGTNAAPTAAADEAIRIIEDNKWDIYYN